MGFGLHDFNRPVEAGHRPFDNLDRTSFTTALTSSHVGIASGNFIRQARLGHPTEEPAQILTRIFDFTVVGDRIKQAQPTLLRQLEFGQLLQKLLLAESQRFQFGIHAGAPIRKQGASSTQGTQIITKSSISAIDDLTLPPGLAKAVVDPAG
jgi:hypothetical protein